MRLFKALFMLLMLVTFSTGFGKTTADLKQNSTAEFVINGLSIVAFNSVNVVPVKTSVIDVGLNRNIENQKQLFNQKQKRCQKLEQSSYVNQLLATKEAKPQSSEPFMEPLKKTRISRNILRADLSRSPSLMMHPPMVYLYQEKITS